MKLSLWYIYMSQLCRGPQWLVCWLKTKHVFVDTLAAGEIVTNAGKSAATTGKTSSSLSGEKKQLIC